MVCTTNPNRHRTREQEHVSVPALLRAHSVLSSPGKLHAGAFPSIRCKVRRIYMDHNVFDIRKPLLNAFVNTFGYVMGFPK